MKNVLLVFLAIIILALVGGIWFLFNQSNEIGIDPSEMGKYYAPIAFEGHIKTCMDKTSISLREGSSWREVKNEPSENGGYYIGDKYSSPNMGCDVIGCELYNKEHPYQVYLVEYKKIGEREPPADQRSSPNPKIAPVYKIVPLKGDIKIELEYYPDSDCRSEKKTFSTTIPKPDK